MAEENERLKLWLRFGGIFIVAAISGIATPMINAQYQNRQLEIAKSLTRKLLNRMNRL